MPLAVSAGVSSPLIVDGEDPMIHGGEFNDIPDDALDSSNLFFTSSPDALHSFHSAGKPDNTQRLLNTKTAPAPRDYPSSPTGSSREDSSSDSADSSSKRESPGSNGDQAMDTDNSLDSTDWGADPNLLADDNVFHFGRGEAPMGNESFFNWDTPRDAFADDMDAEHNGVAIKPDTAMTSPAMQFVSQAGQNAESASQTQTHERQNSFISASSTNGMDMMSRELSPISQIVTSQGSSPSAISPRQQASSDMWNMGNMNSMQPMPMVNGFNMSNLFANAMGQPMQIPQSIPFHASQAFPRYPPQHYTLRILSTPPKSRVETQIPLVLVLDPLPPGVTKLHLPPHTISKPKLMAKPTPARSPDMVELCVTLVCTSAMESTELKEKALQRALLHPQRYLPPENDEKENSPQNGADVRICAGCIVRERKRASRKKSKKPDEEKSWADDEERRVVVFNAHEVKEFEPLQGVVAHSHGAMMIKAPLRIACYCRHHGEKMGFNVIFTIKDWQDNVIAQAMSEPIMITDDHKTHPQSAALQAQPSMMPATNTYMPAPATVAASSNPTPQSRMISRPASPIQGGPAAKKRKSSSGSRVPTGLAMTPLETTQPANAISQGSQSAGPSAATSPFAGHPTSMFQPPEQQPLTLTQSNPQVPFQTNPTTPTGNDQNSFFRNNRSPSMDNMMVPQMYSAPPSNLPSRAPSPSSFRPAVQGIPQAQFPPSTMMNPHMGPAHDVSQPPPPRVIRRIIPTSGPKLGGIEVTVLGTGFYPGMFVCFGGVRATSTSFWSEGALVCLVPPAQSPGTVVVSLGPKNNVPVDAPVPAQPFEEPVLFTYNDDVQDSLMRMALTILGMKMNGAHHDLSDVARRVINESTQNPWPGSSLGDISGGGLGGMSNFSRRASPEELETQLLSCLHAIDVDESPYRAQLDLTNATGHTMLHMACCAGYRRLTSALLSRGADPNAQDNGHFTPLHMAAVYDQPDIARRLRLDGANPKIRSLSGLTPLDLAESSEVRRAIYRPDHNLRSQSTTSLQSRASSMSSLRSLRNLSSLSMNLPAELDDGEESPEYSSGDFSDEDPDENNYLMMRRASSMRPDADLSFLRSDLDDGLPAPPNSPPAAFKEQVQQQFHQLQQSMALHIQNLPHFPTMPQMPQLPQLPNMTFSEYQAYLQQAPFMRRMTQLMPNMTGSRPGSEDGQGPRVDHRWWDFSSFMNNAPTPPPAYEEIYPDGERGKRETKQVSAAQAAAEAEADMKCAQLYDQGESSTEVETKMEIPSILRIGRKNAITKEQQEQFLRAREQKLKSFRSDRKLFFVWIPLLIIVLFAMVVNHIPSISTMSDFLSSLSELASSENLRRLSAKVFENGLKPNAHQAEEVMT